MSPNRVRLAAAVILTAAAGVVVTTFPASAAACPSGDGVTVVVDFKGLGGGVQQTCDGTGGGDTAASLFTSNGYSLTYAQRQPGFVCRVSGAPADDPCVNTSPADAYWGLWWSDGQSGTWSYASQGVGSLTVPEGGYVALAWDGEAGAAQPGASPTVHAAAPSPTPTSHPSPSLTPSPSSGGGPDPTTAPTGSGGSTNPSGSVSPSTSDSSDPSGSPSASRSGKPKPSDSAIPTDSAATAPSESLTTSGDAAPVSIESSKSSEPDGGLPGWVAPSLIGTLFLAAGAAAMLRRRRGSTGP